MPSTVYFGDPRQSRLDAEETLPVKLDRIVDALHLRDRVKDEVVAIKMHLGGNVGYSTIHPVFVRRVVQAVKDGGGRPVRRRSAHSAADRRPSAAIPPETLGCPIFPAAGLDEKYFYDVQRPFKNIKDWGMGGHAPRRHLPDRLCARQGPSLLRLRRGLQEPGAGLHDRPDRAAPCTTSMHFDRTGSRELCPDDGTSPQTIIESCPHGAVVQDKNNPDDLHLHFEHCNQCGRCLQVAPPGSPEDRSRQLPFLPGGLRHLGRASVLGDLRARQDDLHQPRHAHDAGLRLLRLHGHADPAGRRRLRLGRHRRDRAGHARRDRPPSPDRGERPLLDGSPHPRGPSVPVAARPLQGPVQGRRVRREARPRLARLRARRRHAGEERRAPPGSVHLGRWDVGITYAYFC